MKRVIKIVGIILVWSMLFSPASAGLINIKLPSWIYDIQDTNDFDFSKAYIGNTNIDLSVEGSTTAPLIDGYYVVEPGEFITINVEVYNDFGESQYFKTYVYGLTEAGTTFTIFESEEILLPNHGFHVWNVPYRVPNAEGKYDIYVESGIRLGGGDDPWYFDDIDQIKINSVATPIPTPIPTVTTTPAPFPTTSPIATATQTPIPNIPPLIDVKMSKTGYINNYDASGSSDPDGSIISYVWTVDNQPAGTLKTFSIDTSKFTAGTHTVKLVITDNNGASSSYMQSISVTADQDGTTTIQESEAITEEGNILETDQGTAKFVINVAGEPYYLPGFESAFALLGLILVTVLVRRG